ncbi:MAG: hypothetical protein CVV07_13045 [Gammaproteobacteria bacterium HGW-Gammaproteobacteria-11]|nr:MAG: hypothetical protein CVV07_13045 [Gammaproteobacteria bacterium HGW-Gammaproteobacteria-11]
MSDDDIEDDELDSVDDGSDADDLPDEVENDDEPASKPRKKSAAAESDPLEGLSVEAKAREREMLERQIAEFLAKGGKVVAVDDNVVGDPPKKPDSKYGSRPI